MTHDQKTFWLGVTAPKSAKKARSARSADALTRPPALCQQQGAKTHQHQRVRLWLWYGGDDIAGAQSYRKKRGALVLGDHGGTGEKAPRATGSPWERRTGPILKKLHAVKLARQPCKAVANPALNRCVLVLCSRRRLAIAGWQHPACQARCRQASLCRQRLS